MKNFIGKKGMLKDMAVLVKDNYHYAYCTLTEISLINHI